MSNFQKWTDSVQLSQLEDQLVALLRRGWYTNNGPLLKQLEAEVAEWAGAEWAVGVSTAEAAIWLMASVRRVEGLAWVAPDLPPSWGDALRWKGLRPSDTDTGAAMRIWSGQGPLPPPERMRAQVEGVDATHLVYDPPALRNWMGAVDGLVLSMGAGSPLDSGEGGLIVGNELQLRDELRTARNHHTSEVFAAVPTHFNFKMSEAQALFGLRSLDAIRQERAR